jgi:hypothetical protein
MKIFGREPALVMALIGSGIAMISAFIFPLTTDQQGVLNAGVVAVFGLVTAALLAKEKLVATIEGLARAVFAIGLAFGWDLPPDKQAVILTFVSLASALWFRPQVVASVPPEEAP